MTAVTPTIIPTFGDQPRFVIANTGQDVLLRGVNMQAHGTQLPAMQTMAGMGVNFCRLVTYWDRAELTAPTGSGTNWASYTHSYDASYTQRITAALDFCSQNGIYVLVDSHKVSNWSSYFTGTVTAGIPAWYYTDSRFPGQQAGYTADAAGKSAAQAAWWTGDADGATNGSHCNQVFYDAWWDKLISLANKYPNVVMWGILNEPLIGSLLTTHTYSQVTNIIHTWLQPVRDHIIATDVVSGSYSRRGIAGFSGIGGHDGWGTADWSPFGDMQATHMVLEPHSYYRGLPSGALASGAQSGFNATDAQGNRNDYEYPDRTILTTVTADSTASTLAAQAAWNDVFRSQSVALGVPIIWGEWGVQKTDPGRITNYLAQTEAYFDAYQLSCSYWTLKESDTDILSLLSASGQLTDIGVALRTWFQATAFIAHPAFAPYQTSDHKLRLVALA